MAIGKAWSDTEIAASIALYGAMLGLSLNGLKFNKREMIRRECGIHATKDLDKNAPLFVRSRQSVEMKLMNITACINSIAQERGVDYQSMEFAGYKPLNSYQGALRLAVAKSDLLRVARIAQ